MYFREHLRLRKLPWQKQSWSRNRARRRVGCVILVLIPGAAFFHRNGYETCSWNTGRGFANCKVDSVVSDSVRLHRRQPTRLPHPWDSPGKNTGAISFSNAWKWKVKSEVSQSCPTLATPWTATYQAPPSMGFSRQKYWSGVPLHILISPGFVAPSSHVSSCQTSSECSLPCGLSLNCLTSLKVQGRGDR